MSWVEIIILSFQQINWKPKGKGRRIVLVATDGLPKIAGDGRVCSTRDLPGQNIVYFNVILQI